MSDRKEPRRPRLSVVLPAYREQDVIGATLATLRDGLSSVASGEDLELIVVDDGSGDATAARASAAGADRVIVFDANRGKGAAVRAGALAATGDAVVFTDADLQYPPDRIVAVLDHLGDAAGAVRAERSRTGDALLRRLGTRVVSRLAALLVLRGGAFDQQRLRDTQCGLKAFRRDVAHAVFGRCRVDRFGFDVEVLLLLSLLGIPTAVETVEAAAGTRRSTVRVVRDGVGILRDLLGIRRRYRRGDYSSVAADD
ncbi:MAG: glycosyltransferase family 2 protein [Acidimicrobiia bacterium]|nr:glycosyltransferase family 2 protein [Acidimicrobiia bacterium]